jgi:hypothetical protein
MRPPRAFVLLLLRAEDSKSGALPPAGGKPRVRSADGGLASEQAASYDDFLKRPFGDKYAVAALVEACRAGGSGGCPVPRHARVFSMPQVYYSATFHLMVEVLPRVAPFLAELRADEGMMVHVDPYGLDQRHADMLARHFELLGVSRARLVSGAIFADEVVVPTVGISHQPHLNLWGLTALRAEVEARHGPAQLARPPVSGGGAVARDRELLLLRRSSGRRDDSHIFSDSFVRSLERALPRHTITVFDTGTNRSLAACILCQVRLFQRADAIVGSHGAGLSHLMWARRGAVVVEGVRPADSFIYVEMATIFGLKYLPLAPFGSKSGGAPLAPRVAQLVQVGG